MSETLHDTTGDGIGRREQHRGDADPEKIIEAIERPEQYRPDETVTTELPSGEVGEVAVEDNEWRWLPYMDLPGFGELGDSCGEDIPQFCECCADTWTVGDTCRRSTCPRCAQTWCREAATSLASKLKAVWAYRYQSEREHPFYHHLVIDIPDDWRLSGDPETVYWRTLDVIKEILDELGIAGIPIYHPVRGGEETPDDRGEWKNRVFQELDWEEVSGELEFDPHFHILGVAPFIDCTGVERVQAETGWPIHRVTKEDSSVSVGNDYDMAAIAAYCLSHAGIYEDSNGDMSAAYHPRVAERPWRKGGFLDGRAPTIQERTREEMDEIVRSVAPRVLGIDYQEVACLREVPEGEAADNALSVAAGSGDHIGTGDGTGDGTSDAADQLEDDGEVRLVKCQGRALHIAKAPSYLEDDDWRATADYAPKLEQTYREWRKERGLA